MKVLSRMFVLCAVVSSALVTAGCAEHMEDITVAETEGIYIDIGHLKYQVQNSRVLNPADPEDVDLLAGVPETEAPSADETWFAVFILVQNTTSDQTLPTAEEFEIVDTLETKYEPLEIDRAENPWVYAPTTLAPGEELPGLNTAQYNSPVRGAMLLFKLTQESLQNRPLELEVHSPEDPDQVGTVNIDV
jgi:hypothetical protein